MATPSESALEDEVIKAIAAKHQVRRSRATQHTDCFSLEK
jgi:hypothetical protein